MAKIWQIFGIVAVIGAVVFFWLQHERKSAKNEVIIEQQEEEIKEKNNVIQTKNFQQKLISKPASSSDIAARDVWLHTLWEKAESVN